MRCTECPICKTICDDFDYCPYETYLYVKEELQNSTTDSQKSCDDEMKCVECKRYYGDRFEQKEQAE